MDESGHDRRRGSVAQGDGADEAARVLRRLERIEALDRERAPAGRLLGELRELVREAEALGADRGRRTRARPRPGNFERRRKE